MTAPERRPTLAEARVAWTRVALLSFGGPAGQIAVMHRILVEEKRWISDARFLHALNFCMLLPGPEAQQLATYIGWLLHGPRGGLIAGTLFILPGAVALMALSWLYVLYGEVAIVSAAFFGLKAAVLAIVLQAVVRLGGRTLRNGLFKGIALAAFLALFAFGAPFPLVVLTAALAGYLGARLDLPAFRAPEGAGSFDDGPGLTRAQRRAALRAGLIALAFWLTPVALLLLFAGRGSVFTEIALFFSRMAVVTFGGAYAALVYVAQEAVGTYGWLNPREMIDGLGMAETTPGPLVMVLQFVGFLAAYHNAGWTAALLAGTLGGLLATWVTFAPSFAWIFLGAPFIERLRGNARLSAALGAVTAAVVGVILNLAVWFAIHTLFAEVIRFERGPLRLDLPDPATLDPTALALTLLALGAVFRARLGMTTVLAGGALLGILAKGVAGL
jgi:chromate transporter